MNVTAEEKLLSLFSQLMASGVKFKAVFSKSDSVSPKKQTCEPRIHTGKRIIVFEEEYDFGRVAQKNTDVENTVDYISGLIPHYGQINLMFQNKTAEYRRSKSGNSVLLGTKILPPVINPDKSDSLIKTKKYFLTGEEPFLAYLGISDSNGRIHDKKQGKFRQINHFLEQIENVFYALPQDGTINVCDLCCGKSYLSFAVYYYLTAIKKRETDMLCIDMRAEVIDYCRDIADKCGFSSMHFICDDVKNTPYRRTDMLVSLHACDIATDIVLDTAIKLKAGVILSTPCCHNYLNDRISAESLSFVTSYPHLRNKLCEAITDAIRVARLRKNGYSVTVCELTDPENTPKNTLIRAVYNGNFCEDSEKAKKLSDEYDRILDFVLGDKSKDYLKEVRD